MRKSPETDTQTHTRALEYRRGEVARATCTKRERVCVGVCVCVAGEVARATRTKSERECV